MNHQATPAHRTIGLLGGLATTPHPVQRVVVRVNATRRRPEPLGPGSVTLSVRLAHPAIPASKITGGAVYRILREAARAVALAPARSAGFEIAPRALKLNP